MIILVLLGIAPFLVAANLMWHFRREGNLIYEMLCNIIGIGFMWLAGPLGTDGGVLDVCIRGTLIIGVGVYLYTKYSYYGSESRKSIAMKISLLCAAAVMLWLLIWMIQTFLFGYDKGWMSFFFFYYSLVPINFFVTAVSEAFFQMNGKNIFMELKNREETK